MLQQGFDMPLYAHKSGYVKPDKRVGNDLFRAFSYVITGSEVHHLEICRWVCEYMNLCQVKPGEFSDQYNYVSVSNVPGKSRKIQ